MLTEAQLEARRRSLGASEIAAVCGIGRRNSLDVWAGKRRGPNLELPPLIVNDEPEPDKPLAVAKRVDTEPRDLGHLFERAIGDAYALRTGHVVSRRRDEPTLQHPDFPFFTATPDRFVLGDPTPLSEDIPDVEALRKAEARRREGGLEIKLVGRWMRKDWPSDGLPDYVRLQCQWSMGIAELPWWDVAALVDGTDLRIHRVDRDDDLIGDMLQVGAAFWDEYVLGDKMPPARDGDQAIQMLTAKWRKDNGKRREFPTEGVEGEALEQALEVEGVARSLVIAQHIEREAKKEVKHLKSIFCALAGEYKDVAGPWGRFSWPTLQGNPKWKEVSERLADGKPIADDIIEAARGDSHRSSKMYAFSNWKKRVVLAHEKEQAERPGV